MAFQLLPFLGTAGGQAAVGALGGIGQALIGAGSVRKQYHASKKLAAYQNELNKQYLDYYNQYNTPAMQMARFREAGLNPHLIYGQGSPGNQAAPQQAANIEAPDYSYMMSILPTALQSMMQASQVQATNAKTRQTYAVSELNKLQARVIARNPLLDNEGFKATIDALKSSAELKAAQSDVQGQVRDFLLADHTDNVQGLAHGWQKLEREFALLEQRFRLGEADAKLKAEVLTSKEFLNALSEIQVRWMKDGDITPQHILQFIQLLLMKAL